MIIIRILESILILDVLWSVLSFIGAIPIGKPWVTPRFPILITLILMLLQTPVRKSKKYCNVCNRNLDNTEMMAECSFCNTPNPVKVLGIDGRIYYKCVNKKCKSTFVITPFDNARTRFSKLFPYSEKSSKKRKLHCKYCNTALNSDTTVINLSLYTSDKLLAVAYRETFFYNGFGGGCKDTNIHLFSQNASLLKEIDHFYESKPSKIMGTSSLSLEVIRLEFRSTIDSINKSAYQFRIAAINDNNAKLKASEGIIVLINGGMQSIEIKTLIDHFLIDLNSLNTQSQTWSYPVLIGISANGVADLEQRIDAGFTSAEEMETYCKQYLSSRNSEDIIYALSNTVDNIHYFLYRTGSIREGTDSKVYNVIPPVQALIYSAQGEMKKYWVPNNNGHIPLTKGKSI